MEKNKLTNEENVISLHRSNAEMRAKQDSQEDNINASKLERLQQTVGNRVVQHLFAQCSSDNPAELHDETAARINRARGGGQALDDNTQARMSTATGQNFSNVKVHTGSESHALNEELSAKAFTTGSDIFFRNGAYDPGSSSGQELLAHELTHVIQQRSGAVGSGSGKMTVNAPGDRFEQEADAVAKVVTSPTTTPEVQRQTPEEDEELQTKALQRQEIPEDEEETLQRQELDEEEEELNA